MNFESQTCIILLACDMVAKHLPIILINFAKHFNCYWEVIFRNDMSSTLQTDVTMQ